MSMGRFIVLHHAGEWLVTYAEGAAVSFATREEAEMSALDAADTMALGGHAVSVLIVPEGFGSTAEDHAAMAMRNTILDDA